MALNLTATNANTTYVVYDKTTFVQKLETENETLAKAMVHNDSGLEYSTYPPFTYAKDKVQGDSYETTMLEY